MSRPDENRNLSESREAIPNVPAHRLLRRIGRGSYGEVWLAVNAMNKWAAVKLVHRGVENDNRAYEQEFRGLRRYDDLSGNDGSLMPIKNVGEDVEGGFFYYAMELADDATTRQPLPRPPIGVDDLATIANLAANYRPWTLSGELKQHGRLAPKDCIACGLALAESLQVLHQGGLVHRDVKPSNIIFVNGRPKLADVGLVAATDATMNSFAGTSGFVPLYGAGEPAGDIFALGKVLYMAVTGSDVLRFPQAMPGFDKLSDAERQEIAELQAVYERACDPSPEDRQSSAQVLRDELEMLRQNESVIRLRQLEAERERFETQRRETRRRRKRVAAVSLVGVAMIAFGIGALLLYTWRLRTAHEATVAELQASKLSRMLVRRDGWSQRDWEHIEKAANRRLDDAIVSQAISTMSGLDARIVSNWAGVEVSSAAFTSDGRVLVAGFGTNRAMLISDNTNRTELPVVGEGQACWSASGEPLIWQRGSNSCVLREALTGTVRREFHLADGDVVAVGNAPVLAATPDGSLVAACLVRTNGARVVIWDARDGHLLGEANLLVRALSFAPDGSLLAAGDEVGRTTVWSTAPFARLAEMLPGKRPNPINCLTFGEDRLVPRWEASTDKRWLLAVGDSGAGIVIWDLAKRLPRTFCPGSDYNIQSLAFSPDGNTLASAGRGAVGIWDVMSGVQLLQIDGIAGSDMLALAFDSIGNRIAVGTHISASTVSSVGMIELEHHRGIQCLRGLDFQVRKVWFSPNSQWIAALADDWSLGVWDTKSGRLRHLFEAAGFLADNAGGAFDANGKRFGFAAGTEARLYDLESGRTLDRWHLPHGFSEEVQFDSEGRLLLVRRQRSPEHPTTWRWTLYELPRGGEATVLQRQADFSYRTISFAFPMPAAQFVAHTKDLTTGLNAVRAFEVASGQQLWKIEQQLRDPFEWQQTAAGGELCGFAIGSWNTTHFFRVSDGQEVFSTSEKCLAAGPSAREYVTHGKSADRWILRTMDGADAPIHFSFDGVEAGDTHEFSPDGQFIAWGTTGGTVLLANISAVRQRLAMLRSRKN